MRSLHHCLLSLSVVLLIPTPVPAQQALEPARTPEVVASASAERGVSPDRATVTLRFSSTDETPAAAGHKVALRADSLRNDLEDLGIPGDSIVMASRWRWWRDRVQVIPGPTYLDRETRTQIRDTTYQVFEEFEVHIGELERVGQVIDLALARGVTEISGIQFSTTETEAVHREALQDATQKARARAEAIAQASGGRIGRLLQLSTEPFERRPPYDSWGMQMQGVVVQGVSAETVVVPPSLRVIAAVYGRWEFVME